MKMDYLDLFRIGLNTYVSAKRIRQRSDLAYQGFSLLMYRRQSIHAWCCWQLTPLAGTHIESCDDYATNE